MRLPVRIQILYWLTFWFPLPIQNRFLCDFLSPANLIFMWNCITSLNMNHKCDVMLIWLLFPGPNMRLILIKFFNTCLNILDFYLIFNYQSHHKFDLDFLYFCLENRSGFGWRINFNKQLFDLAFIWTLMIMINLFLLKYHYQSERQFHPYMLSSLDNRAAHSYSYHH